MRRNAGEVERDRGTVVGMVRHGCSLWFPTDGANCCGVNRGQAHAAMRFVDGGKLRLQSWFEGGESSSEKRENKGVRRRKGIQPTSPPFSDVDERLEGLFWVEEKTSGDSGKR